MIRSPTREKDSQREKQRDSQTHTHTHTERERLREQTEERGGNSPLHVLPIKYSEKKRNALDCENYKMILKFFRKNES
jgi:hypothetical protein